METLSCGSKVVKYILFIFNFIFWVTGIVLLGVGIWVLTDPNATHYLQIATVDFGLVKSAAICLIAVGGLVFIVGGLGCCGACKESTACLTGFTALLIFLLIIQVVAVILAGVLHGQILRGLENEMRKTMTQDYGRDGAVTESWNFIQYERQCCGVGNMSVNDWRNTYWWNETREEYAVVPQSCCSDLKQPVNFTNPKAMNATACYLAASEPALPDRSAVNLKGCEISVQDLIMHRIGLLIGVTVGVIIVQVVVVVMACILKKNIKNAYEYV
jgi:hypothetical protein